MDFILDAPNVNVKALSIDSPYEYKLKTIYFANKTVDFIMQKIKHRLPKSSEPFYGDVLLHSKTLTPEQQEEKKQENVARAARRARKAVHYAVRQINADHMLTLSTRENIQKRAEFFEYFTKFIRLVRNKELRNGVLHDCQRKSYPYCAVPELQDRGAFHMHIAVCGRQDVHFLRACWYVALGGSELDTRENARGNIDVQYRKKKWGNESETYKTFGIVRYLTKYIDKDFEKSDLMGVHRYSKSRDTEPPIIHEQVLVACNFGGNTFVDAITEINNIAEFVTGINPANFIPWNRGDDIYILRGTFL